ncbi:acyl dehydratase [Ruegeria sp. HKCCD7255]|uniref:acyl dehydratase n=1 Tax=Ruegeria sp. HKCCD7255 TaxID=2683004 RepID=UPI00148917F3|nr:acyl dehydratase [Ruegeria sp. HKCCD7255]
MTQSEPSEIQHDVMDPARAAALQAALGLEVTVAEGSPLPPFFHQLYFWSPQPPHRLGRDGHPRVGEGMIPDMGLPRRMWAGGRLQFHAPLLAGVPAERRSFVDSTETKMGRSGPLGFVILRHAIWQAGAVRVTEWQDLVYREDALGTAPEPPVARTDETDSRQVEFSTTLLFRYSALTFNGHRIHYDADYAKDVEGYEGLVVHGPLLAQHLMLFATELMGPLTQFLFRASSPLMHFQSATLCRNGDEFWVRGPDGRQCMLAIAQSE